MATITQDGTIPPQLTDYTTAFTVNGSTQFAGFNPALGTLTGVTITYADTFSVSGALTNNGSVSETAGADVEETVVLIDIAAPDVSPQLIPITSDVFTPSSTLAAGGSAPFAQTVSSYPQLITLTASSLASFEQGAFTILASTQTAQTVQGGGGNVSLTAAATVSATLDITYTYTPAPLPCYCRGTRILTARGEVAVEDLRVGDVALTAGGGRRPVVWIGLRSLNTRSHVAPESIQPVRISAGAFGECLPRRDLWVSPGHNIRCGDVLIPAILLANGATVAQLEVARVDYFHVELDAHDIVLAEGLAAESYLDCGNRTAFANGGGFVELHPDFAPKSAGETCLPIRKHGADVEAAKAALFSRAGELGFVATRDPALRIIADGVAYSPAQISGGRHVFRLPAETRTLRLASRVWTPGHMRPDSADDRRLGVSVVRLVCDGVRLPLAALKGGWLDGGDGWRWTDGFASLPSGLREIAVDLAGDALYWDAPEAAPCALAGRVA